jgi:hypothetical protein
MEPFVMFVEHLDATGELHTSPPILLDAKTENEATAAALERADALFSASASVHLIRVVSGDSNGRPIAEIRRPKEPYAHVTLERDGVRTRGLLSLTILGVVLVGVSWLLWARNPKWKRNEERRRDKEAKIIAACERGLTHQEVGAMFGVGTERVRLIMTLREMLQEDSPLPSRERRIVAES